MNGSGTECGCVFTAEPQRRGASYAGSVSAAPVAGYAGRIPVYTGQGFGECDHLPNLQARVLMPLGPPCQDRRLLLGAFVNIAELLTYPLQLFKFEL